MVEFNFNKSGSFLNMYVSLILYIDSHYVKRLHPSVNTISGRKKIAEFFNFPISTHQSLSSILSSD